MRMPFFCCTFAGKINHNDMKKLFFLALLCGSLGLFTACHRQAKITNVETSHYTIDATTDAEADSSYEAVLSKYRDQMHDQLCEVIGYATEDMNVRRPECNMVNWTADALLSEAKKYCPMSVDMALVNIGGVRCNWAKGELTRENVFELMPFDNELVVLTLKGEDLLELCQVFAEVGGEGVSGLRMSAEDRQLINASIDGNDIDPTGLYTIATSDYLAGGKDKLEPLTRRVELWNSHMRIRDLYIEYIVEHPQVVAAVDGRMDVR